MQTVVELGYERPATIGLNDDLHAALDRMLESRSTELFVIDDDGRLLGIVPDYELLKARLSGAWDDLTAGQLMSHRLLCFTKETESSVALRAFREGQHSRAAIVHADGRLIGQITRATLLRWMCEADADAPTAMASPKFLQSTGNSRVLSGAAQ